jgi:hypothetical protein
MMQESLSLVKAELERLSLQQKLLQANESAELQAGIDIKKLDASVKKNTALIKKFRNITEGNAASLLDDIARTNQSKVRHKASIELQHMPSVACLHNRLPGGPGIFFFKLPVLSVAWQCDDPAACCVAASCTLQSDVCLPLSSTSCWAFS